MQDPKVCDSCSNIRDFFLGSISLSKSNSWEDPRDGDCLLYRSRYRLAHVILVAVTVVGLALVYT